MGRGKGSLDGPLLRMLQRMATCPLSDLERLFNSFVERLGSRNGACKVLEKQRDSTGKAVMKRLLEAGLL